MLTAFILACLEKRFLFLVVVTLSAINVHLKTPLKLSDQGRDLCFSGVVISEDHRENGVKLLINLNRLLLKNDTIAYHAPVEFYTMDRESYLGKQLIVKGRIANAKSSHQPNILNGKIVGTSLANDLLSRIFYHVNSYLDRLFRLLFSEKNYQLASGLVLGGSNRVGQEIQDVFTRAGVLHILSVSGFNVGFVISFIGLMLILIPISDKIKFLIIIAVLFIYAGITGFQPSVSRASLMACLFGASLVFQRNVDGIHIVNIGALTLLIINPLLIYNISAQLSFASVYGIIYLYPKFETMLISKLKYRLLRLLGSLIAISFSAQLFVSPLLIQYFHRVQTIAIFSNILIVPLTSIITYLLFSITILGIVLLPVAKLVAALISLLINLLVAIAKFFAAIAFSSVSLTVSPIFLILFFLLFAKKLRKFAIYALLISAIIFSVANFSRCTILKIAKDATLIVMPNGSDICVTSKQNTNSLNILDIGKVDYLIGCDRTCTKATNFFPLPGELHFKKIKFGRLIIALDRSVSIAFHDQSVDIKEMQMDEGELIYVVMNDKEKYMFKTTLYGSVIDQIITDVKILIAKMKFL